MLRLEDKETAEFRVGDLFEVINGKKYPKDSRISGDIPLISTSAFNNGISDYISFPEGSDFEKVSNVITIAFSGSVGATYYHSFEVFVGETVMYLIGKDHELTIRQNLFVVSVIKKMMVKYSYSNKVKVNDVRHRLEISLPATPDGEPDWEWMDAYIRQIEERERES